MSNAVNGINWLSLLEQGVEHWNRCRDEHPTIQPDLSTAYLFQYDLQGANLRQVTLSRACLIGANLTGANLEGAVLNGVYASGANFTQAHLSHADLSRANLSEANFTQADLSHAQMRGTNFTAACLTGVRFDDCTLDVDTVLDGVVCEFIELHQQRYPHTGGLTPPQLVQVLRHPHRHAPLTQPRHTLEESSDSPRPHLPIPTPLPLPIRGDRHQRRLLIGGGMAAILVCGVLALSYGIARNASSNATPVSPSVASLPPVPCNEPDIPALPQGAPAYEYGDGTLYYGKFAKGQPANGRGTMLFSSGNRYDGEFRNGQRNGCGTFTFANGRYYIGQFKNDTFHGVGTWVLEGGDRYIGEFRHNKCHGQGTFIFANGSSKTGDWRDGTLVDDSPLSCNGEIDSAPQSPDD